MKKYFYLFLFSLAIVSCSEHIEDNRPALQGRIDGEIYRAIDAQAVIGLDGAIKISGLTSINDLTILLSSSSVGTYVLGGENPNVATFTNSDGFIYTTDPKGVGQVVIKRLDQINQTIYGSFEFEAEIENVDRITVEHGLFFEVPYTHELEVIPVIPPVIPPEQPCDNLNDFVAIIDGESLSQSSTCTLAEIVGDQIVVTATDPDEKIEVRIPLSIEVGQHPIPAVGYNVAYTDLPTMITEEALSGNIIVLGHDVDSNSIQVGFSFTTENHVIISANFDVTYD